MSHSGIIGLTPQKDYALEGKRKELEGLLTDE